jgi:hypothetical protein
VADSEGTWQIGTDSAATIASTQFGQWSPTDGNPDADLWANADASIRPVAFRALKRGITQLAEIADGSRSVLALDVAGTVACESATFTEANTVPEGAPSAGTARLWVKDTSPNTLVFTDDAGTDFTVAGDGSAHSLAATLVAGNTTGANDIEISTGQALVGADGGSLAFASSTGLIKTTAMSIGDPGTEGSGIVAGGAALTAMAKVACLGGATDFSLLLDRHSLTEPPSIVGARSNSDDEDHGLVGDGDGLLAMFAVGWDGADYALGGRLAFAVDGTPAAGEMPTKFTVSLSPAGSESPTERLSIAPDGTTTVTGTLVVTDRHYSRVRGSTARGTTNTRIFRWTTEVEQAGTAITYTDSATLGGYWRVTTTGIYTVSASQDPGADGTLSIRTGAALTNDLLDATVRAFAYTLDAVPISVSWTGPLSAEDLIWVGGSPQDPGATFGANGEFAKTVSVVRVA